MKFQTDSPLTLSVFGALHHLRAASIREVAAHMGSDDHPTRDKVGTTLRRMEDSGFVARGGCATTDAKSTADLWVLTPEGELKRLDLVRRLTGFPTSDFSTTEQENASTTEQENAPRLHEGRSQPVSTTG